MNHGVRIVNDRTSWFHHSRSVPSYFSGYIMIYLGPCPNFWGLKFPWLWLTVRHGIDGPNRNRWFTELENSVIFHGELLVITRWYILWHPSNWGNTLDMIPGSSYWTWRCRHGLAQASGAACAPNPPCVFLRNAAMVEKVALPCDTYLYRKCVGENVNKKKKHTWVNRWRISTLLTLPEDHEHDFGIYCSLRTSVRSRNKNLVKGPSLVSMPGLIYIYIYVSVYTRIYVCALPVKPWNILTLRRDSSPLNSNRKWQGNLL